MRTALPASLLLSLAADEAAPAPGSGGAGVTEIPETAGESGAGTAVAEGGDQINNGFPQKPEGDPKPTTDPRDDAVFNSVPIGNGVLVLVGTAEEGDQQPPAPVALVHVQSLTWERVCDPENKKPYLWAPCITGELLGRFHPIEYGTYDNRVLVDHEEHREVMGMSTVATNRVRIAVHGTVRLSVVDTGRCRRK